MFDNEKQFKHALNQCTEDYGCLVLDTTSTSNKLQDQVFYYKAKPDREFKIGEENWKNWDKMVKDDEEGVDDNTIDVNY